MKCMKTVVKTFNRGGVRIEILEREGETRFFYDYRVYRPYEADGEEKKAWTFSLDRDAEDQVKLVADARNWVKLEGKNKHSEREAA